MRKLLHIILIIIFYILAFVYNIIKALGPIPSILLLILVLHPKYLGFYFIFKILAPLIGAPMGVLY